MKKSLLSLLFAYVTISLCAQNSPGQFGMKLSGFVKSDFFYDTHETVNIREGHFLLYPTRDVLDDEGNVINDNLSFNFLSIQTRLTGRISGPDAFGARTSGMIEADFFGNENSNFSDLNGLRMRHAFVKMNWEHAELLAGQFWHPMFVPECFPEVISFNTGAPFQAFSRNPQLRYSFTLGKTRLIAALNSQRDFASLGGSQQLRNSAIPELNLQLHFRTSNEEKQREFTTGLGLEHKVLVPRLSSKVGNDTYEVNEKVNSSAVLAFMKYQNPTYSFKVHGIYGQNLSDLVMLGGYASRDIIDTVTGEQSYLPIANLALWFEGIRHFKGFDLALFGGYSQNLGASDTIMVASLMPGASTKARGGDIHSVYRIAPRIVFISGKLKIATELEYTAAAYNRTDVNTLTINDFGVVTEYKYIGNWRGLLSFIYVF